MRYTKPQLDPEGDYREYLQFIQALQIAVCVPCAAVYPRDALYHHFNRRESHGIKACDVRLLLEKFDAQHPSVVSSSDEFFARPRNPRYPEPLPYLPTYAGLRCTQLQGPPAEGGKGSTLAGTQCNFVTTNLVMMQRHSRSAHGYRLPRGRPGRGQPDTDVPWTPTCVQRLRPVGRGSEPFEVGLIPKQGGSAPSILSSQYPSSPPGSSQPELSLVERVYSQISSHKTPARPLIAPKLAEGCAEWKDRLCSSKWQALTQWPVYLHRIDLLNARRLICLPPPYVRPRRRNRPATPDDLIRQVTIAFDTIIQDTRQVLVNGGLSIFDQHRVSSFQRGQPYRRPLFIRLLESTYRNYQAVWKQLLCFTIRRGYFQQGPEVRFVLTEKQSSALDRLMAAARSAAGADEGGSDDSWHTDSDADSGVGDHPESHSPGLQRVKGGLPCTCKDVCYCLHRYCVDFCITLLDHELRGDIFESAIVAFLAVLGIKSTADGFREPDNFTGKLSALIKLAQFLVVRRALDGVKQGEAEFPSELLDDMQDRFMVYGCRSPIDWAFKLRTFGRQVQDQSTSIGHVRWSEDGDVISFKQIRIVIPELRWFIRDRIADAQLSLEQLLLLETQADGQRDPALPPLSMRQLKDDASVATPGWSFLCNERNQQLQGKDSWLLDRVCSIHKLRSRFMYTDDGSAPRWRSKAVESYLRDAVRLLERLLLLTHLTSGQPARGTELLSAQIRNSESGHSLRRTVFIENGLVSIVTSSMKGYSIEHSTRIIHRYLPPEVSELLVYYIWLIEPFCRQLRLATLERSISVPKLLPPLHSGLLWGDEQGQPWTTNQLRVVMEREFGAHLDQQVNVAAWRHIAIAMSRRFLPTTSFKRDYDKAVQTAADFQAGHSSLIAGNVYGRMMDAAPGFVDAQRSDYRDISLRWHRYLGFGALLPARRKIPFPAGGKVGGYTDNDSRDRRYGSGSEAVSLSSQPPQRRKRKRAIVESDESSSETN